MTNGDSEPLIEMRDIEKRFGSIQALSGVHLRLHENEILGLLGDNGSGKSTLMKILVGLHEPTAGEVFIRGEKVDIENPKEARKYGISTVYQDLALANDLTVAENMFLGRYPDKKVAGIFDVVDYDTMREESERVLRERLNLDVDPTTRVELLSGGERQAVAIGRALITDPDIVIMDEPTSALSADSAQRVRELIENLRDEGITVIIISHDLNEVFSITDRLTILDNGNYIGSVDTDQITEDDVVRMMVGGKIPDDIADVVETTPDTATPTL